MAENIPIEPDAGNSDAGKKNSTRVSMMEALFFDVPSRTQALKEQKGPERSFFD